MNECVAEILKDGIKAEVLARLFYVKGQRSTSDRELIALFGSLAEDETRHESQLRHLYRSLLGEEAPEQVIETTVEAAGTAIADPLAVLRLAIEREERARNYYRFLAAQVDGPEAMNLLMMLESQEERHHELLESELKGRRELSWTNSEPLKSTCDG